MQKAYAAALYELIRGDRRVISCLSDSGTDYDALIAREFPEQVINFGISENNQVAAAAGLAAAGKIPFVYTTGAFLIYRSCEFIRDDICLQNRNVKLVGMGSGLSWSTLGPTHHTTEDIGILRSMPNLTVLSPGSPMELAAAVKAAYLHDGPVYIRMGMSGEREIYSDLGSLSFDRPQVLRDGKDATVFTTGSIVSQLLEASQLLETQGLFIRIVHLPGLKPLAEEAVAKECRAARLVVSVEEHTTLGGLGSAIADAACSRGVPLRLHKLGLPDCFAGGFGTHLEVLRENGLDPHSLARQLQQIIQGS